MTLDQFIEGLMVFSWSLGFIWGLKALVDYFRRLRTLTELAWIWFTLIIVGTFLVIGMIHSWRVL